MAHETSNIGIDTNNPKPKLKPPFPYFGGKEKQAEWILRVMSRYDFRTYIEPFGGSGAVLFAKEPSDKEVFSDFNAELFMFYKVLRDPQRYEALIRFIRSLPCSREMYNESYRLLQSATNLSSIERAGHFYVKIKQSFGGKGTRISRAGWSTSLNRTGNADSFYRSIERMPEIHKRLQSVVVEHIPH